MSDKKAEAEIKRLINENEEWLSYYGAVTPRTHDAFLSNIYANFPCVKYVEYYIPTDDAISEIQMILYIDVIAWLTNSNTIDKLLKFIPILKFVNNKKLEELLDVLPYLGIAFIADKRLFLESGIKSLAAKALEGYDIKIHIRRWKKGTPKVQ